MAGPIFEGTYEHIYSKDFTYGSSILFNLSDNNSFGENISLTPFARFYFQETREYGAYGFFVEGFGKILAGKSDLEYYDQINTVYRTTEKSYTATALGLSLGRKWVNHSGFVMELAVGVGRTLSGNEATPDAFFRGDLSIGYRF